MKVNRKYKLRRIAFGITREELAAEANVDLMDVVKFESGIRVSKKMFDDIQYALYNKTAYIGNLEHIKKRIVEIALCLNEEDDKAMALNNIEHIMIELERLSKIYKKDLL